MQLKYGNYSHDDYEASVKTSRKANYDEGGRIKSWTERWNIEGFLQADSQAALFAKIRGLESAYSRNGGNIGLYTSAGAATPHVLLSSATIGGTKVVEGPNFPKGEGPELGNYRSYSITVEGEILNTAIANTIISFMESLTIEGGGARDLFLQPLQGPPVRQRVATQTPYRATQQGTIVGYTSYPTPPAPLFPGVEFLDRRRIIEKSPKRDGPPGSPFYETFPVEYYYYFESATPLFGHPNRWIG